MTKKLIGWMLIVLLIPVFFHPLTTNATSVLDKEAVDKFVADYIDKNGLPGASIVIVKDGEVVHEKGFGHDSEGQPITEKSLMRIGSVSKTFTAFSVLQLVDEGKIHLDDPIMKYIPEVKLDDSRWKEVTIRQLLNHTSGVPNPLIVPQANNTRAGVERLHDWQLQSEPGEKYAYSNPNYWILAFLVEKVSGIEFDDYLKRNVFSPLDMNDSLTAINSGDFVQGLPKGYITAYGTAIPLTEMEQMQAGAGGVITNASDMGKWLSMHTNVGENESGDQLLSVELLKESYSPQPGSEKNGLGWSLSSPHVQPARISHSGALSTYQTQQDIIPSSGYAVAVLLNSFTTTFEHAYEISAGIIQVTEGNEPEKKASIPKIMDLSLGFITLVYLVFGVRGIIHCKKWIDKRQQYTNWRFILRLTPQLAAVLFVGWYFFVVPNMQDNSSTIKDAFGIYPAAAIFLIIVFIIGLTLTIKRLYQRFFK